MEQKLSFTTGPHHRLENLHVPGAATEIPGQTVADFGLTGMRILLEQIDGGHDHARCADAALGATAFYEGLLHRMQLIWRDRDSLDGGNRRAGDLGNRDQTTVHNLPVYHHTAGAALTFAATLLGAGEVQLFAQHVKQPLHWIGGRLPRLAVNLNHYF